MGKEWGWGKGPGWLHEERLHSHPCFSDFIRVSAVAASSRAVLTLYSEKRETREKEGKSRSWEEREEERRQKDACTTLHAR